MPFVPGSWMEWEMMTREDQDKAIREEMERAKRGCSCLEDKCICGDKGKEREDEVRG